MNAIAIIEALNQKITYRSKDSRYRIGYSYFGYSTPMLGVWFMDKNIGVCHNELGAERVVLAHIEEHQG